MRDAASIVDKLLESDSPYHKPALTLEYRPFKKGDVWKWYWVLHAEDKQSAVASDTADSRPAASTQARLAARRLKGVITGVQMAGYAKKWDSVVAKK